MENYASRHHSKRSAIQRILFITKSETIFTPKYVINLVHKLRGPLKNGHERSNIIPVLALSPLLGKVGWKLTCAPKGSIVDNESRGFAIMHHSKTDVSNEKFTIQNVFSCHVKRSLIMIDFCSQTHCASKINFCQKMMSTKNVKIIGKLG